MSTTTNIEWTDATWNPIRGCSRVSEGCRNCYAEKVAYRFSGPGLPYEGLAAKVNGHAAWTGKVRFVEKHLLDPMTDPDMRDPVLLPRSKWPDKAIPATRPRRIFVNSMSDLFHENVPDEWIDRIFAVMALCPQHQFQVLTKRPERMLAYLANDMHGMRWLDAWDGLPNLPKSARASVTTVIDGVLPNVWLGVSDEGNRHERVDILRQVPAAVRFVSAEPLIFNPASVDLSGIDWVICGGESGPGARPMHPDWARSLRDQCRAAGVPFFFKQWGEYGALFPKSGVPLSDADKLHVWGDGVSSFRFGKKAAGAMLDGREWREFPEAPNGR